MIEARLVIMDYLILDTYFTQTSPKTVLEVTYGRVFHESDSYFLEKLDTYNKSKHRWLGQLDYESMDRLVTDANK